ILSYQFLYLFDLVAGSAAPCTSWSNSFQPFNMFLIMRTLLSTANAAIARSSGNVMPLSLL
ncbi:MAG: hypothetical protein ACE5HO_17640, partial [bacterium]